MKKKDISFLAVLGAGESGVGAAILGKKLGMEVLVSDSGTISPKFRAIMEERSIPFEEGGHSSEKILNADVVVKSPGIPPTAPLVEALVEKGVPVVSEIEFAGWFTDSKMMCITGSNGKTTTTMLIWSILKEAGFNPGLAGNVGYSLARQVAEDPHPIYVIELSSFQLENMYDFKADIAVMLNITPDHMDRYDHRMDLYTAAKFRILQNQTPREAFIYWEGDPVMEKWMETHPPHATLYPFGENKGQGSAAYVNAEGNICFSAPSGDWKMERRRLSLPGLHNLYNSMAAALAAGVAGVNPGDISRTLEHFTPVEHRLEFTAEINGVRYINDSKATNVNSTWYALESMTAPTVLILGGKDKGNDYTEILPLVRQKVKAIVCMGKENSKLLDFFGKENIELRDTHSVAEAVKACARIAEPGDCVLLSPCCASFDLFSSYEDRGRQFKAEVNALKSNS